MKRLFVIVAVILNVLLLSACAPRGETHSVQQILETERSNYIEQAKQQSEEPLKSNLMDIAKALEDMVSANGNGGQIAAPATKVADSLSTLVKTAGYTSRASIGEIALEHRMLGQDAQKGEVNPARVKLLVARTYNVLASELETTKFSVQPLARPA